MKVEVAPFDVTDQEAVLAGVARIEAEHGPIEVLVNNAGI
jgi:gluconate 5-dehydrogenase